jgi:hypothetical protein
MHRWIVVSVCSLVLLVCWLVPAFAQAPAGIIVAPSSINVKLKGKMHVTVLCSATVNPELIDPDTLLLGPGEASPDQECELVDVNADGCADLVCRFTRADVEITCADTTLTLTGSFVDATTLTGTSAIKPVPCKK